jgi:hypothetical protein
MKILTDPCKKELRGGSGISSAINKLSTASDTVKNVGNTIDKYTTNVKHGVDLEKYLTELKDEQMKKLEALNEQGATGNKTKDSVGATSSSSFKFPISYVDNKQEVNDNIINDLDDQAKLNQDNEPSHPNEIFNFNAIKWHINTVCLKMFTYFLFFVQFLQKQLEQLNQCARISLVKK